MDILKKFEKISSVSLNDGISNSGFTISYVENNFPKDEIEYLVKNGYIYKDETGYYITKKGIMKINKGYIYRKKPVEIRAFQMTKDVYQNPEKWPAWIHQKRAIFKKGKNLFIQTLEGDMKLSPDNWVIEGVNGELYSCDPEIFEMTYEKI